MNEQNTIKCEKSIIYFWNKARGHKNGPVIKQFANHNLFKVATCSTGQHLEMLDQVVDFLRLI